MHPAKGKKLIPVINPATEEVFARVAGIPIHPLTTSDVCITAGSEADVDIAVDAARRAFNVTSG